MKRLFLVLLIILLPLAGSTRAQMGGDLPSVTTDPSQAFVSGSIVVKGEGAAPADRPLSPAQKRILALRAAKVVALREAAEVLNGVSVYGETQVVDAAAQSDTIRATVQGLVKGAQVIKEAYDPVSEFAVVYVSIPLTGPNGLMARLLPQVMPSIPPAGPLYQPQLPPARALPNHDGLILDVRAHPFRPALINRILTKNGEVIYDPTKVAQEILVERGAAEYTNDIGKAKAILGERGANNPLVVKAEGLVRSTDVKVSPDDASVIFASNQKTNFLEGAKVVFVLK